MKEPKPNATCILLYTHLKKRRSITLCDATSFFLSLLLIANSVAKRSKVQKRMYKSAGSCSNRGREREEKKRQGGRPEGGGTSGKHLALLPFHVSTSLICYASEPIFQGPRPTTARTFHPDGSKSQTGLNRATSTVPDFF